MAKITNISWCDSTFNPFIGCQAVSPGCDNCYAKKRVERYGGDFSVRRRTKTWGDPLRWNKQHEDFFAEHGRRQRVFCASLADVFDNEVSPEWRRDLFALIRATPNLDWLLLTKRIGNADRMLAEALSALPLDEQCGTGQWDHAPIAQWPWPNVWLGATVVNQEEADRDIPKLLAVPAHKRFLSIEPLLGQVDLRYLQPGDPPTEINALAGTHGVLRPHRGTCARVDWVIAGGESGPGARPMHPDWARSLRQQCESACVPFFMKQMGGTRDKRGALDDLPEDLRVREFPHAGDV